MSIVRWQPFEELQREMNRLFRGGVWHLPRGLETQNADLEWQPSSDITETDKEYLIHAELPGVKKDDIRVTVDKGAVTFSGERKTRKESKDEKVHRLESFQGRFARSFSLPTDVDQGQVKAEISDGILVLHLPKTPTPSGPKPVEVKVA